MAAHQISELGERWHRRERSGASTMVDILEVWLGAVGRRRGTLDRRMSGA